MIRFSRSEDYAVILVGELSEHFEKGLVSLSRIAKNKKLSLLFLRNIAHDLRKANIVTAVEGKNGGYKLTKNPNSIQLGEIIKAVAKRPLFSCCQNTKDGKCHTSTCSHGFSLQRLNNQFLEKIYTMKLSEVANT